MRRLWATELLVVAMVGGAACFGDCFGDNDPPDDDDDDEPSRSYEYRLVEASGEISVTGTRTTTFGCSRTTTDSKLTFGLPVEPSTGAGATFRTPSNDLYIGARYRLTTGARVGSETCDTSMRACPSNAEMPNAGDSFLSVQFDDPPSGVKKPTVLFPRVQFYPPQLCANGDRFDVSEAFRRAKPLSAEELSSGRFVLESQGSASIDEALSDDEVSLDETTGTMTWNYRFVFQTADYQAPNPLPTSPSFTFFDQCSLDEEATDDSLFAAAEAFAAGQTDIAINPSGCRRLKVTKDGALTRVEHVVNHGTEVTWDAGTGTPTVSAKTATPFVRELTATSSFDKSDVDGDGFFESTNKTTFDGAGTFVEGVAEELTAPATVTARVTVTPATGGVHVKVERLVSGSLQVEREFDTPSEQLKCETGSSGSTAPSPTCKAARKACTPAQVKSLYKRVARASKRGSDCIAKTGFKAFDYGAQGLTLVATEKLNIICTNDPCDGLGSLDPTTKDFMINLAPQYAKELDSTVFHELLHSDWRFHHDDALTEAAAKLGKLSIADRTYACEKMCYGKPDACTCIRCLAPQVSEILDDDICKECESKYGSTKDCAKRYEGGKAVASAVGAWCSASSTMCDTKAECDTSCMASNGRNCMPIRATCDPNCN